MRLLRYTTLRLLKPHGHTYGRRKSLLGHQMRFSSRYSPRMKRLTIHLGLPKTGSTSLQTQVFFDLPGYLGRNGHSELEWSEIAAWRDAFFTANSGRPLGQRDNYVWDALFVAWLDKIVRSPQQTFLISDELFLQWPSPHGNSAAWPVQTAPGAAPRRGVHPVVNLLSRMRSMLPPDVDLKTVVVLRNQSDWLGSLAAELAVENTEFVQRLIDTNDAALNYYSIVLELETLLGPSNHLTLFHEDGPARNAERILSFSGYPVSERDLLERLAVPQNVRRVNEASWATRGWHPVEDVLAKLKWIFQSTPLLSEALPLARRLFPVPVRQRVFRYQPRYVSLSTEDRERLRSHCQDWNSQLAGHVGENLRSKGY